MATNINSVVITGNLTRDPEVRGSGNVCVLRVAVNSRHKNAEGEWEDKPNYFDVAVFDETAEHCANYLAKGRAVAVDGRLEWREWENDAGEKRQAVSIIGNNVQFLGSKGESNGQATSSGDDDLPF